LTYGKLVGSVDKPEGIQFTSVPDSWKIYGASGIFRLQVDDEKAVLDWPFPCLLKYYCKHLSIVAGDVEMLISMLLGTFSAPDTEAGRAFQWAVALELRFSLSPLYKYLKLGCNPAISCQPIRLFYPKDNLPEDPQNIFYAVDKKEKKELVVTFPYDIYLPVFSQPLSTPTISLKLTTHGYVARIEAKMVQSDRTLRSQCNKFFSNCFKNPLPSCFNIFISYYDINLKGKKQGSVRKALEGYIKDPTYIILCGTNLFTDCKMNFKLIETLKFGGFNNITQINQLIQPFRSLHKILDRAVV